MPCLDGALRGNPVQHETQSLDDVGIELIVAAEVLFKERAHRETGAPLADRDVVIKRVAGIPGIRRQDVQNAVSLLFDQGTIRTEWVVDGDREYRALRISGEARGYVELIAERIGHLLPQAA